MRQPMNNKGIINNSKPREKRGGKKDKTIIYSVPAPKLVLVEALRRLPCSLGVTSLTFLGDIIPDDACPVVLAVEALAPAAVPAVAAVAAAPPLCEATPSIPLTFSTALLSPRAQGSRLTNPTPALRLVASRRFDSSCKAVRLCSRRGPGPQSCMQPGVAQPPSLIVTSRSHMLMQAVWPPWPQPWHQVQRVDPLARGAANAEGARWSRSKRAISDSGMGSVRMEEWEESG
jgi:hypothetical protein